MTVSTLAGLPDLSLAATRLRQTPVGVADVVRAEYGAARGDAMQRLLEARVDDTTRWLAASRAGDAAATSSAQATCHAGSVAIANAFVDLGVDLSVDELVLRLDAALGESVADARAFAAGDWAAEIAIHDAAVAHAADLADVLATAIAAHRAATTLDVRDEQIHVTMRALSQAHVRWTRSYLVATLAGLASASADLARLERAQHDIGDALRPYVGDPAADALTLSMLARVAALTELVMAAMSGDAVRLASANTAWYAAGDAVAAALARTFPASSATRLVRLSYEAADVTAAEAFSRVHGDWRSDLVAYDVLLDQSATIADELSAAIRSDYPD